MFRSLATRLTATYVFAAMVLVVVVIAAVTALYLSMFGISAREMQAQVVQQIPEELKLEIARNGSLEAAAGDIARHLSRPGLRVIVLAREQSRRRFLAEAIPDSSGGATATLVLAGRGAFGGPDGPSGLGPPGGPGSGGPGGPGGPGFGPPGDSGVDARPGRRYDRMTPYPFALNNFLQLAPRSIDFNHGRIMLFPDPGELIRAINAFWIAMAYIGVFVVAAAWLLGRYITGQALRPLVETTASLRRFGDGDFTPRPIETKARDEIGALAQAYNAAAAQVSSAFEERAAAELEMRQFIADAGHELRTPLTVIMGFVDVLRRRAQNESTTVNTRIFDTMLDESRRMKALIDKLIVLARLENSQPREFETVDLAQIAGSVATSHQALGGMRIDLQTEPDALVRGYESELHDAVSNLVENALKYAPESPVLVRVFRERETVCVEVADRGPGIPAEEQSAVFSRFYRGRDRVDTDGFGLGLAISRRAVERAGGTLTLASEPKEGSRFTICIPRATRGESVALAV